VETVLIVDDEAEMCAVAGEMREEGGYAVLRAHDARQALNIVEHHPGPIDLLLTDVVMPGMNAIVFAERVRLGWPARRSERCPSCRLLSLAGAFPLVERSASI
jgi:CheY-like chemotaxis protein